jgi:hypothetical protein
MARVFIETTIPSYYHESRTDRRSRDWREQTRLWWDRYRGSYELVTSDFVIAEYLRAPYTKAAQAAKFFQEIEVLSPPPRLEEVIQYYIDQKLMPRDASGDAAHLAMGSLHSVDFILTWNCRHLANANKVPHLQAINKRLGLPIPIITTPFELIPE